MAGARGIELILSENKITDRNDLLVYMVRERGLEPPRPEGHQPLKLTRLPIPPFAHESV
jgi:hypothetical protein